MQCGESAGPHIPSPQAVLAHEGKCTGEDKDAPHVRIPGSELVRGKPVLDTQTIKSCVQYAIADGTPSVSNVAVSRRTHRRLFQKDCALERTPPSNGQSATIGYRAVLATWWRWAGHTARLADREPTRWISKGIHWKDATCRQAIRGLPWTPGDPERQRLGRGLRGKTSRRWDDPVQKACESENSWQQAALDKTAWSAAEEEFLIRILRRRACEPPAPGRFMLDATS